MASLKAHPIWWLRSFRPAQCALTGIKFDVYERAGVREYWLVDPHVQFVEVYVRAESGEFVLLGQFRTDEQIHSEVLTGFTLETSNLFAQVAL